MYRREKRAWQTVNKFGWPEMTTTATAMKKELNASEW